MGAKHGFSEMPVKSGQWALTLHFCIAQWATPPTGEMATTQTHRLKGRASPGKGTSETGEILERSWGYEGIGLGKGLTHMD